MNKSINKLMFVLLAMLLLIMGCTNPDDPVDNSSKILDKIVVNNVFDDEFIFPTEVDGYNITWESKTLDVISNEGYAYLFDEDKTAVLSANITIDEKVYSKDFEVTVKASQEEKDLFNLAWEYYEPKLAEETVKNLKLTTRNYGEFSVRYESKNEDIITSDGIVTQNIVDQVVTFNIIISKGIFQKVYQKDIKVLKYTDAQVSKIVLEWVKEQVVLYKEGVLKDLPCTHPLYGTTIVWYSDIPGVISPEGVIVKPVDINDCTLTYEVRSGSYSTKGAFMLEDFGGATVEEFLDGWLPTQMPTKIVGSINHIKLDGIGTSYEGYYLDYQERTNIGGVLNLIDGKVPFINKDLYIDVFDNTKPLNNMKYYFKNHPSITQTELDNKFYEGYTSPNEENILWITVHESAMTTIGHNAKFLAQMQYNTAYVNAPGDSRNASWHYQVDENNIYQSFPDSVAAWHAGEKYGNYYAIGIEMCVNQDGNYEGAMRNNAKLIAYLMHQYNLTLENVKRHYDFSGKECPSYMIRTNRWVEFTELIAREYIAMKYLSDAEVKWTVSDESLFIKGGNNLLFNKEVHEKTEVEITLEVTKGSYHFKETKTLVLYPNK